MSKSTRRSSRRKPAKPHADFPLFGQRSVRQCKKVRQRFHYFGKVADDPEGQRALELRLDLKGGWLDYPRPKTGIQRR